MINRTRLIQIIEPLPDVEGQSKRERFYKLSALGLLTFIKKNPSPYEFWGAMIWYGMTLNPESADRDEFDQYYNLFIETLQTVTRPSSAPLVPQNLLFASPFPPFPPSAIADKEEEEIAVPPLPPLPHLSPLWPLLLFPPFPPLEKAVLEVFKSPV
jgi:hypothetical protein